MYCQLISKPLLSYWFDQETGTFNCLQHTCLNLNSSSQHKDTDNSIGQHFKSTTAWTEMSFFIISSFFVPLTVCAGDILVFFYWLAQSICSPKDSSAVRMAKSWCQLKLTIPARSKLHRDSSWAQLRYLAPTIHSKDYASGLLFYGYWKWHGRQDK